MVITPLTEYAGFWRRALAIGVDILWLAPLLSLFLYLLIEGGFTYDSFDPATIEWQALLINETLQVLLIIWFWVRYAATPGKLLFDCEIVDARTGKPINFTQALLRYFGYFVSMLFLGLGFLWIIVDKRKQGWHDKIAGTVVVIHDEATVPLYQLAKYYR